MDIKNDFWEEFERNKEGLFNNEIFFEIVREVKKKKEFSDLDDSFVAKVVKKVIEDLVGKKGLGVLEMDMKKKRKKIIKEIKKETRKLLRKIISAFMTDRILKKEIKITKDLDESFILTRHRSTRERFPYYTDIYRKIFTHIFLDYNSKKLETINILDLGAGVNGLSYRFMVDIFRDIFREVGDVGIKELKVNYTAIEIVGQLVNLMNTYFTMLKTRHHFTTEIRALKGDLFNKDIKEKIIEILKKMEKPRIVFLWKIVDGLESLKKGYSLNLINSIMDYCEYLVISFPTQSLGKKERFTTKRFWLKKRLDIFYSFRIPGEEFIIIKGGEPSTHSIRKATF